MSINFSTNIGHILKKVFLFAERHETITEQFTLCSQQKFCRVHLGKSLSFAPEQQQQQQIELQPEITQFL